MTAVEGTSEVTDPSDVDGTSDVDQRHQGPSDPSPARLAAADAMRRLGHAIVRHDVSDEDFGHLTDTVTDLLARVTASAPRPPRTLAADSALFVVAPPQGGARGSHFTDCIVTGPANPMGVAATIGRDGDDAVLHATLGDAFEGAPGRGHGGIVAALFDEVMGFVLSIACTPAFTGRLTVTYRAPVPLGVPLVFRARLTGREGRKLLMTGEARDGDTLLAQADSLFIAVDSARFTAGRS